MKDMFVLAHVLIALTSVIFSGYIFFSPSQRKIYLAYGLTALTIASGTYLVISAHSPMLQSCLAGLAYLTISLSGIVLAGYKLKGQPRRSE